MHATYRANIFPPFPKFLIKFAFSCENGGVQRAPVLPLIINGKNSSRSTAAGLENFRAFFFFN